MDPGGEPTLAELLRPKVITDGGYAGADASRRWWQEVRPHFGRPVAALLFDTETRAAAEGFGPFPDEPGRARPRAGATFVLLNALGDQAWLSGCCCGEDGWSADGAYGLLFDEGFIVDRHDLERSVRLRLHHDAIGPVEQTLRDPAASRRPKPSVWTTDGLLSHLWRGCRTGRWT